MKPFTPLIRRLLQRKYVWYDDKIDRWDRSRWFSVIHKQIVGDTLYVVGKRNDDYVMLGWSLEWNNRAYIPEDKWFSRKRNAIGAVRDRAREYAKKQR